MSKNGKPDFWDWIGIQKKTDYTQFPAWLGHFIGWVFSALALILVVIGLGIIGYLVKSLFLSGGTNPAEDIRNLGLAAGAVIGVPFLIWRSVVAQKQVDVAEQGHITDRINKAVEGLGAEKTVKREGKETTEPNLEVRIGALYALERISQDSARDHIQIMEILCAYIRQNADRNSPALPEKEPKEGWREWGYANRTHLPLDVDIALRIIERRSEERKQREKQANYRLGLERAPFHALYLSNRDLSDGVLTNAQMRGADLSNAKLQNTDLFAAALGGAILWETKLQGANLMIADLNDAYLFSADLQGANLSFSYIEGASLTNAKFDSSTNTSSTEFSGSACVAVDFTDSMITLEQLQSMFGDTTTILPNRGGPDHPDRPTHWHSNALSIYDFETAWRAWQAKIGFQPDQ